jgi:uncharacterized RDD family membrane protein YckC
VILLPLTAVNFWMTTRVRLFPAYAFIPGQAFGLFYEVYLVYRFGGTPGKLIAGLRIRDINGGRVTFLQALLRNSPALVLSAINAAAVLPAMFRISDAEFQSLSFIAFSRHLQSLEPHWIGYVGLLAGIWEWGELIVLLTNEKKRALHDFLAGTVVIRQVSDLSIATPDQSLQTTPGA